MNHADQTHLAAFRPWASDKDALFVLSYTVNSSTAHAFVKCLTRHAFVSEDGVHDSQRNYPARCNGTDCPFLARLARWIFSSYISPDCHNFQTMLSHRLPNARYARTDPCPRARWLL